LDPGCLPDVTFTHTLLRWLLVTLHTFGCFAVTVGYAPHVLRLGYGSLPDRTFTFTRFTHGYVVTHTHTRVTRGLLQFAIRLRYRTRTVGYGYGCRYIPRLRGYGYVTVGYAIPLVAVTTHVYVTGRGCCGYVTRLRWVTYVHIYLLHGFVPHHVASTLRYVTYGLHTHRFTHVSVVTVTFCTFVTVGCYGCTFTVTFGLRYAFTPTVTVVTVPAVTVTALRLVYGCPFTFWLLRYVGLLPYTLPRYVTLRTGCIYCGYVVVTFDLRYVTLHVTVVTIYLVPTHGPLRDTDRYYTDYTHTLVVIYTRRYLHCIVTPVVVVGLPTDYI